MGRFSICMISLIVSILLSGPAHGEFYKYVDENGVTRFVDDKSKIPLKSLEKSRIYKEKRDFLSDEEKAELEKRRELLRNQKKNAFNRQKEFGKPKVPETAGTIETPVIIRGNRVLVPVTIGYRGEEINTYLLLDTGASITVLHEKTAAKLNIENYHESKAQVAGGGFIKTKYTVLGYVRVGPYSKRYVDAGILNFKGRTDHKGLLGMNFLRGLDYKVDFERSVIQWRMQ